MFIFHNGAGAVFRLIDKFLKKIIGEVTKRKNASKLK